MTQRGQGRGLGHERRALWAGPLALLVCLGAGLGALGAGERALAGPPTPKLLPVDPGEDFEPLPEEGLELPPPEEAKKPALEVAKPAPDVAKPAPEVARPAPDVARPAPEVAKPPPEAARPAPEVATPAPEAARPAPEAARPAPEVARPAPEAVKPSAEPPRAPRPAPEPVKLATPAPEAIAPRPAAAVPLGPDAYARRRVLVIGLDGLRPDVLALVKTPNLDRLAAEGAVSWDARAASVTLSGPAWTTLLTGVETDKHGVFNNRIKPQNDGWPTLFARLREARPGARTASYVAWKPLYDALLDPHDVDDRVYHSLDRVVVRAAVKELTTADPVLTFIHLDGVDAAGHRHGFDAAQRAYRAAIEVVDGQVGELVAALRGRPNKAREEWLVIVTTDHGGTGKRHGGNLPTDRRIFLIAHGPTVVPGPIARSPSLLDVAPTVFAHLGVIPKPSWKLEGDVVAVAPDGALPTSATAAARPVTTPAH